MISMQSLSAQPTPAWRTPLRDPKSLSAGRDPSPATGLPSLSELRDAQKSMKKEMAARKVQAVRERRDALMLIVKIDPRAALKMTVEMAKELKAAVEDYVDAGGKNVTDGEMAMMRRDATDAREVADTVVEGLPTEPRATDAQTGVETATIDAEMRRAQAAYATAFGIADARDEKADRADAVYGAALADKGFFEQVKLALGELKEARDKIKADRASLRLPDKDDWKVADKAMAELEKTIDMAPTGAPEISDAPTAVTA